MNPKLIRNLIANSESLIEVYLDEKMEALDFGNEKLAIKAVQQIRGVNSTIRAAKKALLEIESKPKLFDNITGSFV